jgi:NAD-dependent DNA ligase
VNFVDRLFCFTGKFFSGTRQWCEDQVVQRGGAIGGISRKLNYLVVGEIGSRDWIHSTHGRKIEKAVELVNAGDGLAIVGEEHWVRYLDEVTQ